MRQARKRAIARRAPYQVGFGITLGVFLSLMGLMLFERILLVTTFFGLGYYPANDMIVFLYGADNTIGPLECMAVALAGLLFAQAVRAIQALRLQDTSWSGFAFGACNIGMIAMFTSILLINWAFYNPLERGAHSINGLSKFLSSGFQPYAPQAERLRKPVWEQIDDVTYCHAGAGIIESEEIIRPSFPIKQQRANYLARSSGDDEHFHDGSISAKHYYDLDWNLLTINASMNWPVVRERLEEAGKQPWDGDSEVYYRLRDYENAPDAYYPSCKGRITAPAPAPTYPLPQAAGSD